MAGLEIPTWGPETAVLIGTILLGAVVLYAGYAEYTGIERLLGPRLLRPVVEGVETGR